MINKERKEFFKSLSSVERKKLILQKMYEKGIKPGSGVPNKIYDNSEVENIIKIVSCFPDLRK